MIRVTKLKRRMRRAGRTAAAFAALCGALALPASPAEADGGDGSLVPIQGGRFESVLPPALGVKHVTVANFHIDRMPVTNEQFARFVRQHPQWRRGRAAGVFADDGYLQHWPSAAEPGAAIRRQPVVHVSWFAASAYCESRGARLPTWHEWEYVAAASESRPDARSDAAWRQRILTWYSQSARVALADVGRTEPNLYGVQDLHGLIWEWVEDLGGMLVAGDSREQSDPDLMRFCGPGALTMEQKENYAMLMRIAMLSSMQARYTSATMGFRCAAGLETSAP